MTPAKLAGAARETQMPLGITLRDVPEFLAQECETAEAVESRRILVTDFEFVAEEGSGGFRRPPEVVLNGRRNDHLCGRPRRAPPRSPAPFGEYPRIGAPEVTLPGHPVPDRSLATRGTGVSRRLRYIGSNSGNNGCPTLYEDEESGNVVVQGDLLTAPDEIAQMRNVKPGEGFVTVPRVLLGDFAPRDAHREPVMIGFDEFEALFESFQHTAFRLETRRQYRSDEL